MAQHVDRGFLEFDQLAVLPNPTNAGEGVGQGRPPWQRSENPMLARTPGRVNETRLGCPSRGSPAGGMSPQEPFDFSAFRTLTNRPSEITSEYSEAISIA